MATKYVYLFGDGKADGSASLRDLLGGKGADLAEMARMGIPVPPGFTITTDICNIYVANNESYPEGVKTQLYENLPDLEKIMGAKFGDEENPLLVSVRSGARVSMPGMMDTILNLGLNDSTVRGLAKRTGNERFAYDCYLRLIQMYGDVAMGVNRRNLEGILEEEQARRGVKLDTELTAADYTELIKRLKTRIEEISGKEFPHDVEEQLWGAISAVFKSWNTPRAIAYREINRIAHNWGTAANVQAMVFGNMGDDSGSGVTFSRNPATGEKELFGEFLLNAQGEDVVAGIRTPRPVSDLAQVMPQCYAELVDISQKLERHFREIQDIEFTIQSGKLWILQTRAGKRTAQAAVKIALDMAKERLIDEREALMRIEPNDVEQLLHPTLDPSVEKEVIAKGLPASPGAASGEVIFESDEVAKLAGKNGDYILVRDETSADDIRGISAAAGVLTSRGGITSHAAVVARGMGRCCIVGCDAIHIDFEKEQFTVGDRIFRKGDFITLDGSTGEVISGKLQAIPPKPSAELKELMLWEGLVKKLGVKANADNAKDAKLARDFGAEGIGLCRTEHMFFQTDRIDHFRRVILAEGEEERRQALTKLLPLQRSDFVEIFRVMEGLPVTIRLLDPPLHEFLPLPHDREGLKILATRMGIPLRKLTEKVRNLTEFNPMLGHRGCRLGITFPEIYEMQVRAIIEAASELMGKGLSISPEIMLPLVSHVEELKLLSELVANTCAQVGEEKGAMQPIYRLGIMIELPRAALIADELAEFVDFFSFGTNDLTQTTFGLSRDDGGTFLPFYLEKGILKSDPFTNLDEAGVAELIRIGVERGRKTNPRLEVGICGEHGGDPKSIEFFHQIGLDYVSCSPYRVPIARLAASQAALKATA